MLDRFRPIAARLFQPGLRVLVGYSGGPDSTSLLHLLHLCGVDVVSGHLHHGQREEADQELKLCEAFCEELGIPFVSGRADVPKMAQDLRIGLEEAGRKARYAFFEQASFRLECDWIATAHTKDDHAESVLLNLARGTGMTGLRGIPEIRGNIVRPLLAFQRDETRRYCEDAGLWTHDDPANVDIAFSRVRIRHRVIPELKVLNPSVHLAIARMAEILGEEDDFLNQAAAGLLERSELQPNGALSFLTSNSEIVLSTKALRDAPIVLVKRGLRLAISALGVESEHSHLETILTAIHSLTEVSQTMPGGQVVVEVDDTDVHVRKLEEDEPFRYPLTNPGETDADVFGWTISAYPIGYPAPEDDRENLTVTIDAGSLRGDLYFRSVLPGDRMAPLGMEGEKKIAALLQEKGLTSLARKRLPLICDMVGPIWIPGVALANRVKRTEGTTATQTFAFRQFSASGTIMDERLRPEERKS